MGQFLSIGLATKIGIQKKELEKAQINIEQLQEKMKEELNYIREIYTVTENDEFYYLLLNDNILHEQLIPFLEIIYPLLYDKTEYYYDIIEKLKILPNSEWIQFAKKKQEAFQFDKYGMCDYLEVNHSEISVYYDCILLSLEGKIMMEVFGRQFKFFKYTMM